MTFVLSSDCESQSCQIYDVLSTDLYVGVELLYVGKTLCFVAAKWAYRRALKRKGRKGV